MAEKELLKPENRRKLELLRNHYTPGFAAAVLSRVVPSGLISRLVGLRTDQARAS